MTPIYFLRQVLLRGSWFTGLLIYLTVSNLTAQPYNLYRIYFRDKKGSPSISQPEKYLSPASLQRRQRYLIPINDQDIPVSQIYLDSLKHLGLNIVCTSRWMNAVVVADMDESQREKIAQLSFVKQMVQVADTLHRWKSKRFNKFYDVEAVQKESLSVQWPQLSLNRGYFLHEKGFWGKGIHIAVIDAGFAQAPECSSLNSLYREGRLLGTRDFVFPGHDVYTASYHGTAVLSVMAAEGSDSILGTAPLASYLLLRSEDITGEYPAEEDFWVAAAEYADSVGVDIINTSLGYTQFDNPAYNYRYSDMNGITAYISQAASIAASKGILVVVSAGNDGNKEWHYIGAPADARGILAVGALDETGIRAPFSSAGPTADGRIKPDIMAMGRNVRTEYAPDDFRSVSGTSFSAPIISGLAACLWEAFPHLTADKIREAIIRSSSLYHNPDSLMGYGIPDFSTAFAWLQQNSNQSTPFALYPNPCRNTLTLEWYNPDRESYSLSCFGLTGQLVFSKQTKAVHKITLDSEIQHLPAGPYLLRINHSSATYCLKFIKL